MALLGIAVAVAAATFFAASERMLLSVGRARLQRWVSDTVRGAGWASARFGESPGHLLGPIRAGHAVAAASATILMAATVQRFAGGSAWAVAVIVTLVLGPLLFAADEVASDVVVNGGRDQTSISTARALGAATWIFMPISWFADRVAKASARGWWNLVSARSSAACSSSVAPVSRTS
jgi:Mg2+/Co2+ transporter CorB